MEKENYCTLEINSTSKNNRGDELMAVAMAEKLREIYSDVRLVVPYSFSSKRRLHYGFYATTEFPGRPSRINAKFVRIGLLHGSNELRDHLNIILASEIDAVLDASGFAYSDQWPLSGENFGLFTKMSSEIRKKKH